MGNYRATIEPLVCVTEFTSTSSMPEVDEEAGAHDVTVKHGTSNSAGTAALNSNNNSPGDIKFRFDTASHTVTLNDKNTTKDGRTDLTASSEATAPAYLAVSKLAPVQLNLTPVSPTNSSADLSPNPHRLPSPLLNPPSAAGSAAVSPVSGGSSASIALPVTSAGGGSERQRRKIERNTSAPLPGMLAVSNNNNKKKLQSPLISLSVFSNPVVLSTPQAPSRKFLTPTCSDSSTSRSQKDHMAAKKRASARKHGEYMN